MNRKHATLSFSTAVPAFGEDRIDLLATSGAPPGFGGRVRSPGSFGYEFPRSLRIGVVGHPYLRPAFDRRKLSTSRAQEIISEDTRDAVGLAKVPNGCYERDILSGVDANQRSTACATQQIGRSAAAVHSRFVRNAATRNARTFHAAPVSCSGRLDGRLRQGIFLPKYGSY